MATSPYLVNQVLAEATTFIKQFHKEKNCLSESESEKRLASIRSEVEQTGSYSLQDDELAYGGQVAWRNNTRCIGRLYWKGLILRDMRHLQTAEEIFEALLEHITFATNGGKIRPMLTVFAPQEPGKPGIRIWNSQLIRYAGYEMDDGTVIGDPLHTGLTTALLRLGWQGGARTPFDLLPLVIQMPYQAPKFFELPRDLVLEVDIQHSDYPWFADLGLKWHALPAISNMLLSIGGISFTAAPFNGWYMGAEIGSRNLGDIDRYNLLPLIAQKLGIDTSSHRTLWKDRALIELNAAVLESFARSNVTIVDHHTASQQFVQHEVLEKQANRELYANWGWIVPPLSGSATAVFHRKYNNITVTPNFFYQSDPWCPDQLPEEA